jgi:hypothetical protein
MPPTSSTQIPEPSFNVPAFDEPYRFGRRPTTPAAFPFTDRQFARPLRWTIFLGCQGSGEGGQPQSRRASIVQRRVAAYPVVKSLHVLLRDRLQHFETVLARHGHVEQDDVRLGFEKYIQSCFRRPPDELKPYGRDVYRTSCSMTKVLPPDMSFSNGSDT